MNERLNNQLKDYKRTLENRKLQASIYTGLIIVTLLFFDFFGFYSLAKITRRKYRTLKELESLVGDLEYKRDQTELLKRKLEESQYYLEMLEEAVPKDSIVENYMVSLVGIGAKHGFKQDKLVRKRVDSTSVELRASFKGSKDQMQPFIMSVEEAHRLSAIESFHYTVIEDTVNLEVVVKIYYIDR